jgi:hypothetical protein
LTSEYWQNHDPLLTETRLTDFIRTTIATKELDNLGELICGGEGRFFELMNHTSRNPAIPLRTFLGEDVKGRSRGVMKNSNPDEETYSQKYRILARTRAKGSHPDPIMTSEGALPPDQAKLVIMTSYLQSLNKRGQGRHIFGTKNGHLGLGVANIAIGDQVAVLGTLLHRTERDEVRICRRSLRPRTEAR